MILADTVSGMAVLRRMTWSDMTEPQRERLCHRGLDDIFDPALRASIGTIIDDVREHGDEAVCRALRDFDGITLEPHELRVSSDDIESAKVSGEVDLALDAAITNLRTFNTAVRDRASDWWLESAPGLFVGEKVTPIASAGLFVPSGKASYPSVAYQIAVPAVVAGVAEIALVVPPVPGGAGEVDPAVLVVCRKLGIDAVFRVNGPAGIAALGFGTQSIPKVRKVVGPGSPAVTCAQVEMQRHGVATMMLLGPTESVVIADQHADVMRLAADLLIEAEHGTDTSVVLVTTSPALADAVDDELARQLADLPEIRATAARAALGHNGGCVFVGSLAEAADVVNRYAPEHLQLALREADLQTTLALLTEAGEILLGQDTPFSAANYLIGCPASLPTSGFAHVSSGITVEAFLKRTALAQADPAALRAMSPAIVALADHEGFPAHGAALRRRHPD
ncbi:MAG: hisD [Ilumatobacteraceae bacterium]|nr:hisD [Ilumatobacteraceae bacterium]MCU1389034.1 hisD [Ilumatobacteraceae bacterium]